MRFPQPRSDLKLLAVVLVLAAGCHSGGGAFLAPASPEAAVRGFLNAVKTNSMTAMSELWGSEDGPASRTMTHTESARTDMEQRLTVMRIYLEHDKFDIMPANSGVIQASDKRIVDVRLYRRGCMPVVPFTAVRAGSGWLVSNVELAAAGNPALGCRQGR
jgi:hypothetical protein